jgi:Ca2+-binding EF-hand superfamily protein
MTCRVWAAKLPIGKSDSENALRDELFRQFDPNGNGYLSLAEVDKGVQDILGLNVTASLSLHLVVWLWG